MELLLEWFSYDYCVPMRPRYNFKASRLQFLGGMT